jgi:hypothetical protein
MSDELQEKQCIVSKIDQILQIQLMKLQSEKDAIAKYRELYLQYFRNAKNATITSAAFVATFLIATVTFATVTFKVVPQLQGIAIIFLLIDAIVGLLAFAIFGNHLRISSQGWLKVEDAYNEAISHLQDLRIFAVQKTLKTNLANTMQLDILSCYSRIHLHKDRIEICDALEYALNSIYSTSYTTKILVRQLDAVKKSLKKDEKIIAAYINEFEREKDFLSELDLSRIKSSHSSKEGGEKTLKRLTRIDRFFNTVAGRYLNSQSPCSKVEEEQEGNTRKICL